MHLRIEYYIIAVLNMPIPPKLYNVETSGDSPSEMPTN